MELFALAGVALVAYLVFAQKGEGKGISMSLPSMGKPKSNGKTPYPLGMLLGTSSIVREVQTSTIPRTSGKERLANANRIFKAFKRAGWSDGVALAAIVNADYESKLSNKAIGDSGSSVGLFQVHKVHGMSVSDRMNPTKNINFILADIAKNGHKIVLMDKNHATVAVLAGQFGHDIERPRDRVGALTKRAVYAQSLFPMVANKTSAQIEVKG